MSSIDVTARLTESITVKRISAHTSGGDPARANSFTTKARIQRATSDVNLAAGRDSVDSDTVIAAVELLVGDLVFFPEANVNDDNTGRLVKSVARRVALDGVTTHWTATL